VIITEGKVFAALIKRAPGYDYKFTPRSTRTAQTAAHPTPRSCARLLQRWGEVRADDRLDDLERAGKAGLLNRKGKMYESRGTEMLHVEGPLGGDQAPHARVDDGQPDLPPRRVRRAGRDFARRPPPTRPQPLTDPKAVSLKADLKAVVGAAESDQPDPRPARHVREHPRAPPSTTTPASRPRSAGWSIVAQTEEKHVELVERLEGLRPGQG
jgi:hypothetical protein